MDLSQAWFKPETVLPDADRHTALGLFGVNWLPFMLFGELFLSLLMRKQVGPSTFMQGGHGLSAGNAQAARCMPLQPPRAGSAPAASWQPLAARPPCAQVYNLRQLISNLSAPFFFHLAAREWRSAAAACTAHIEHSACCRRLGRCVRPLRQPAPGALCPPTAGLGMRAMVVVPYTYIYEHHRREQGGRTGPTTGGFSCVPGTPACPPPRCLTVAPPPPHRPLPPAGWWSGTPSTPGGCTWRRSSCATFAPTGALRALGGDLGGWLGQQPRRR